MYRILTSNRGNSEYSSSLYDTNYHENGQFIIDRMNDSLLIYHAMVVWIKYCYNNATDIESSVPASGSAAFKWELHIFVPMHPKATESHKVMKPNICIDSLYFFMVAVYHIFKRNNNALPRGNSNCMLFSWYHMICSNYTHHEINIVSMLSSWLWQQGQLHLGTESVDVITMYRSTNDMPMLNNKFWWRDQLTVTQNIISIYTADLIGCLSVLRQPFGEYILFSLVSSKF